MSLEKKIRVKLSDEEKKLYRSRKGILNDFFDSVEKLKQIHSKKIERSEKILNNVGVREKSHIRNVDKYEALNRVIMKIRKLQKNFEEVVKYKEEINKELENEHHPHVYKFYENAKKEMIDVLKAMYAEKEDEEDTERILKEIEEERKEKSRKIQEKRKMAETIRKNEKIMERLQRKKEMEESKRQEKEDSERIKRQYKELQAQFRKEKKERKKKEKTN
jgi:hypothetical protein